MKEDRSNALEIFDFTQEWDLCIQEESPQKEHPARGSESDSCEVLRPKQKR